MIDVRIRDGLCPDPSTGEGGATEGDIRGSFSDIIDTIGVKDLSGGHALVTENSPAAMSVLVAPGIVYIPNADYDELDSNTVKFWEAVISVSTAVVITANTSGSTRIDLICAKMDTAITPDEHASNIATLVAVAGTPGAGVPATPDNYAKLAEIEVADSAATIVTADITDSRVQSKFSGKYLGMTTKGDLIVASAADTPARLAVGSDGQFLVADSSQTTGIKWSDTPTNPYKFRAYLAASSYITTASSFTKLPLETENYDTNNNFDTSNNRYVAPVTGYYHFDARIEFNGSTGRVIIALYKNGVAIARGTDIGGTLSHSAMVVSTDLYLEANQYIEVYYYCDQAIDTTEGSNTTYLSGHLISL